MAYNASLMRPLFAMKMEIRRLEELIKKGDLTDLDERIKTFATSSIPYFKTEQGIECARNYVQLLREAYKSDPLKNSEVSRVMDLWRQCGALKKFFPNVDMINIELSNGQYIRLDKFLLQTLGKFEFDGDKVKWPNAVNDATIKALAVYLQEGIESINDVNVLFDLFKLGKQFGNVKFLEENALKLLEQFGPSSVSEEILGMFYEVAECDAIKGKFDAKIREIEAKCFVKLMEQMGIDGDSNAQYATEKIYYNKFNNSDRFYLPLTCLNLLLDDETPMLKKLLSRTVEGVALPPYKYPTLDAYLSGLNLIPIEVRKGLTKIVAWAKFPFQHLPLILKSFPETKQFYMNRIISDEPEADLHKKWFELFKGMPEITATWSPEVYSTKDDRRFKINLTAEEIRDLLLSGSKINWITTDDAIKIRDFFTANPIEGLKISINSNGSSLQVEKVAATK